MKAYDSCVLVFEVTQASALAAQLTPAWLQRCAKACAAQLLGDVAPFWGEVIGGVRVAASRADVQPGEMVFAIVDALPDAPGAIAYHDVTGAAVPVAFLALSTCQSLDDVSTAISHELVETTGDAGCNLWADDGAGAEWARELCDAVESNTYPIDLNDGQPPIRLSDFVIPTFFEAGAAGPYSFLGSASAAPPAPFGTAAGGYQIRRSPGTGETQVNAHASSKRGLKVLAGGHHWSSRPARRGVLRAPRVA